MTTVENDNGLDDILDREQSEGVERAQIQQGEEPASQAGEATRPVDLAITAEILLHPFNNPAQAVWLCQKLKDELKAEVLYLMGLPEGTVIKVSIRSAVSLVDFLTSMQEVAEAWEEAPSQAVFMEAMAVESLSSSEKPSENHNKVVCVALRPS